MELLVSLAQECPLTDAEKSFIETHSNAGHDLQQAKPVPKGRYE